MHFLKTLIDGLWVATCLYMVVNGLSIVLATSGTVQGSQFGMLITLANELGAVLIWLSLFGLRAVVQTKFLQTKSQSKLSTPITSVEAA